MADSVSDRILSSEFGEWNYREFLFLCLRERQSKAQYLRNLAVARTAANRAATRDFLEFYARRVGVPVSELEDWITRQDAAGKSPVQIVKFLESHESQGELEDL